MLRIDFESDGFPESGPVENGLRTLSVDWGDILWAAMTIGRPNLNYVFRNEMSSVYEAIFRISAVRLALEQSSPHSQRLRRTAAARHLDPSEKGALNYFLGMTMCKLFADKCLDAPWMLHLDVFHGIVDPNLRTQRSRPDLIGKTNSNQWVVLESKGRVSPPSEVCKEKAKKQSERIPSICGTPVSYQIGAVTYFRNDTLKFFWRDPTPDGRPPRDAIKLDVNDAEFARNYYQPLKALTKNGSIRSELLSDRELDLKIEIIPDVSRLLDLEKWEAARDWCLEHRDKLKEVGAHSDGIRVKVGPSWEKRFSPREA